MFESFKIGNHSNNDFTLQGIKLPNSWKEKILDVIIDNQLKFDPHIKSMCTKAAQKLGVLNRISWLLNPEKKKMCLMLP